MTLSLLDQDWQLRASLTYDDTIASSETPGVAEAQITLEGDLNVLRTRMKSILELSNWHDQPEMTLKGIYSKVWAARIHPSAFEDVASGTGLTSVTFDTAIKGISGHNDGDGTSLLEGVIVNATKAYELRIRDHDTQDPLTDGSNNEVYGRLSHSDTPIESGDNNNQLSSYSTITGVEDANTDAEKALHFSIVDDGGGFYHIDIYKELARTTLQGHTATYNSTGAKAIVEDNSSGLGGTITVDAVTAADVDIKVIFGQYLITWYSWVSGVETAYNFTASVDLDLAMVLVSYEYQHVPFADLFIDTSWHDVSGISGTIDDANVTTGPFTDLLTGLSTQEMVNAKLDDLGSSANGEGLSLIDIEDASGYFTGTHGEAALNELEAQIGGLTSTTYAFTDDNVLADNDNIYPALDKLDLKWGDLGSVANAEGASLVGLEDAAGNTAETDVEGAIAEIYGLVEDAGATKTQHETTVIIAANTPWTLPGGITYTPAAGGLNMDVIYQGQTLFAGTIAGGDDYEEVSATQIKFRKTIPVNRNLIFKILK